MRQFRNVIWLLFGMLALITSARAADEAYTLSGYASRDDGLAPINRPFELSVRGTNWSILTYPSPTETNATNFHWKTFSLPNGNHAQAFGEGIAPSTIILNTYYPASSSDNVSEFIWLMLTPAVRDHLDQGLFPPVYDPKSSQHFNPNGRVKCSVEYLDDQKLLPRHLVFANDGTYFRRSAQGDSIEKYHPPFDEGFTEADFTVTLTTNWHGMTFPLAVSAELNRPGRGRFTNDVDVKARISIVVERVGPVNPELPSAQPFDKRMDIADARVMVSANQPTSIKNDLTNWPTVEQSTERRSQYLKAVEAVEPTPWPPRAVLLVLLAPIVW